MSSVPLFQTVTFGPQRAIGMRYEGKNENGEVAAMWGQVVPRICSEFAPLMRGSAGVCRCVPGKTDGTMEYIAAFLTTQDTPAPEGLVAVDIPQGEYAVFTVPELDQCMAVWMSVPDALKASPELESYCQGPEACECAAHPCFEYYPPEYRGCGPFQIYIPVKRRTA